MYPYNEYDSKEFIISPNRRSSFSSSSSLSSTSPSFSATKISKSRKTPSKIRTSKSKTSKSRVTPSPNTRPKSVNRIRTVQKNGKQVYVGPVGAEIPVSCDQDKKIRFPTVSKQPFTPTKEYFYMGGGAGGKVYKICAPSQTTCTESTANAAVKYTKVNHESQLDSTARDHYFLRKLQTVKVDKKQVVPVLYLSWACNGSSKPTRQLKKPNFSLGNLGAAFTIVEKFDIDVYRLAERQAIEANLSSRKGTEIGLLNRDHLLRMYRIAVKLGKLGIIWSDLKLDQFLYRFTDDLIVGVDFGFAGVLTNKPFHAEQGWPSNTRSPPRFPVCPSGLLEIKNTKEAIWYNVWQLQAYLVSAGSAAPMYVRKTNTSPRSTFKIFTGVKIDNAKHPEYRKVAERVCPHFVKFYLKTVDEFTRIPRSRAFLDTSASSSKKQKRLQGNFQTDSFTWKEISSNL
jgi:hypothetical protein